MLSACLQAGAQLHPARKAAKADTTASVKKGKTLPEVVVTAKEVHGPVTTSVIGRDAMNQLQPNSFADLLELLPGGYSKDPDMGSANLIGLRETGTLSAKGESTTNNNYAISSLGTQFIVDGAPINTDANLQFSPLSATQSGTGGSGTEDVRNITNKGVDMRTLSTDDIDRVEVVRGIPSVEYGNLTSGIVNIHKIRRATPLTARFKADGYSKLFAVGKGLKFGSGNVVNVDLGYLDSKTDPTDNLSSFSRVNASLRYTLTKAAVGRSLRLQTSLDYVGSVDDSKQDPDMNYGRIDEYKSTYNRTALTTSLRLTQGKSLWREFEVNASVSVQNDRMHQRRLVAPQRYALVPTSYSDGENEAKALYAEYMTDYRCYGKPFSAFVKAKGVMAARLASWVETNLKYGLNWEMSKNYGQGQVYDLNYPLTTTGWSSRPRKYSDIPALHTLSAFLEDELKLSVGETRVTAVGGVRLNTMPHLDSRYDMAGHVYVDPRVNVNVKFPSFDLADLPVKIGLNGGWGKTTKNPTLNYLYPDKYYSNFMCLTYYDTQNPSTDSRFVVHTYVQDPTNYHIQPARNTKWEVRLDLDWGDNSLSVDYFRENMTSGFRYSSVYGAYTYNYYDATQMAAGVDWRTLPSEQRTVLDGYRQASNGSRLLKEGVELQFTSARIRPLRTRVVVSGAWFRTTYTNSQPMFETVSGVVGGKSISDCYVGLYDWNDGRINDRLNTNVVLDTQIPEWGFIFTTSAQFMWRIKTQSMRKNGVPTHYLSAEDGELHPYTDESAADAMLQHLVKTYNDATFDPFTVPMSMIVNFKATKTIGRYMKLSFFANKILDYLPDYESNGNVIRRNASPYFGVEVNITVF